MLGVHIDGGVLAKRANPQDAVRGVCERVRSGCSPGGEGQDSLPVRTAGEREAAQVCSLFVSGASPGHLWPSGSHARGGATTTKLLRSHFSSDLGRVCPWAEPPTVGRVVWWGIRPPTLE